MPTQLLLAPTGCGKTEYALSRIRTVRAQEPLAPMWVILPNQMQVRAFGQRLGASGGALGVELGTFYRYYAELLAHGSRPTARLPDAVLYRLLLRLVSRLTKTGTVRHYAPLDGRTGFAHLLRGLFRELKEARIQRKAMEAALVDAPPRLAELAAIYAAYQDWLTRPDSSWMDAEGQGWLAVLALEHEPALAADLRLLVVDGFDEFNPTQLAVLAWLAGRAAETIITLTGDLGCDERIAHRRFCRARHAVEQALHVEPEPLPGQACHAAPTLFHLESALFRLDAGRLEAQGAVTCIEAQNRAAEVRAALRWLKILLVREGHRPDQVALLVRDLEPYRPYLNEVAAEFGLPLHVAGGQPLAANPAVAALLNVLALPATNWPRRPLLDALTSPYLDWSEAGIGPEEVRELEAAARAGLVIAGLEQWREALARLAHQQPRDAAHAEDEELASPDAALPGPANPSPTAAASRTDSDAGGLAHKLQGSLEAVIIRLTPPASGTLRDCVAFVEDAIGQDPKLATRFRSESDEKDHSLRIVARAWEQAATAERDVTALRGVKDVLRGLVLAEAILPEPDEQPAAADYASFFAELRGAIEVATYEPPPPPPGSAILAAPLTYARGLSFRAVALLGLSEGEFPRSEREDPLLTESDREALRAAGLPLESHLQGDEASLFYEAITRARERLLLTRPTLADDGQDWEPSPYWHEVLRLIKAPVLRLRSQDPLPPADIASLPEALLTAARGAKPQASLPDWDRVEAAAEIVRAREATGTTGNPWEGDLHAVAPALAAHYGPDHVWSASRLETYATCPFMFLAGPVLGLEPRLLPSEGYDASILGTMYHAVLEGIYRRALPEVEPERLRALLPVVAAEVFDAAPTEYGFRPTAYWACQWEELRRVLAETLEALIEATAGWQPVALEQAFGIKGRPPLDVECEGRRLRLRGFIDRLDRDASGRLQVIDYKAGSSPISVHDLENGKRMQLPLYALAVREALGLGEVGGGFYWHVGKAQPSSLRLESYPGGVEVAMQTALEHALDTIEAVRAGQFPPRPPDKDCPGYCPVTAFCWRYRPQQANR